MRKALIIYVKYGAKGEFCRIQDPQALCVCVAAASGVFFNKHTPRIWEHVCCILCRCFMIVDDCYRFFF